MKDLIKIFKLIIVILFSISLLSTYLEKDIAKRNYEFGKQDYLNGDYLKKFKNIDDVNKNRIASYRYNYEFLNNKFYLDFFILILIFTLFFVKNNR